MDKIGSYGVYQKNYYENTVQGKNEKETVKSAKTEKQGKTGEVTLSNKARALLQELKKTYSNMDFIVADYENDDEAAEYLSRGTKDYSVLMDPETLEEMAANKETKEKYLNLIDESTNKLSEMKEQLTDEEKGEVAHLGVSIGKDGTVSYFAELEKLSDKQKERIEKSREDKKEKTAKEQKAEELAKNKAAFDERVKRTRVTASSADELLKKIREVDWNKIPEKTVLAGSRFDYSI